jgi:hypothetical protein
MILRVGEGSNQSSHWIEGQVPDDYAEARRNSVGKVTGTAINLACRRRPVPTKVYPTTSNLNSSKIK